MSARINTELERVTQWPALSIQAFTVPRTRTGFLKNGYWFELAVLPFFGWAIIVRAL